MFGPSACTYQALTAWATARGLSVDHSPSRIYLGVAGSAAQIDAARLITLGDYKRPNGSVFYAPDRDPSIDSSVPVTAISGLDNCFVSTPAIATAPLPAADAGEAGAGG